MKMRISGILLSFRFYFFLLFLIFPLESSLCNLPSSIFHLQSPDSLITMGNRYYMEKNYDSAAACYATVIRMGYESGELYYNLGNAHYKLENLSSAILNYEKALELKPGDEDIRQNLALANARIVDKIEVIPVFFLRRWMRQLQGLFPPDTWAVLALALFILALASFYIYTVGNAYRLKRAAFAFGVICLILSCTAVLSVRSRIKSLRQSGSAIIMVPSVNAKSSPDDQSTNIFVLHEGTRVELTDSVENWREIRIPDGNKGWVLREVLGEI